MKNRKVRTPKIYLVLQGIYGSNDAKNFDSESFLLNKDIQDKFFSNKNITAQDIQAKVWFCRYAERDLIKKKKIQEKHYFFKRVLKVINANEHLQKEMCEFFTMMYFEDNSICNHWDLRHRIKQEDLQPIISRAISSNYLTLDLFINNLGKEYLENMRIVGDRKGIKPPLDIKTKAIIEGLSTWGPSRNRYKNLLNSIKNHNLNLPDNFDLVMQYRSEVTYYYLSKMELPHLNKHIIEHDFDGDRVNTTVENIAKYNSMVKGLTECLKDSGYDLDGNVFKTKNFEQLVDSFYKDPFLKERIVKFMMAKGSKAKKPEFKIVWNYNAIKNDIVNNPKQEIKEKKKVNKV